MDYFKILEQQQRKKDYEIKAWETQAQSARIGVILAIKKLEAIEKKLKEIKGQD